MGTKLTNNNLVILLTLYRPRLSFHGSVCLLGRLKVELFLVLINTKHENLLHNFNIRFSNILCFLRSSTV